MYKRKKVVVIGMLNSIHLARWVLQFEAEAIDFILIPSTPFKAVHSLIENRSISKIPNRATYRVAASPILHSKLIWLADKTLGLGIRGRDLARILKKHPSNYVHALEFQNAGYLLLDALKHFSKGQSQVIVTNYGSDIYWFQHYPRHLAKIRKLLSMADRYSAECARDVDLAIGYGFTGKVLPVIPNAGGFSSSDFSIPRGEPKSRSSIMVKGYDGWVGRARVALDALEILDQELSDYEITVYSADKSTVKRVKRLRKTTGLNIEVFAKNSISHDAMMSKFRAAKLYIGVSLSDGISTSLLEAMVSSAVPIQSFTACTDGWFVDGIDGVVLRDFEAQTVANAILEGLEIADRIDLEIVNARRAQLEEKLLNENIFSLAKKYYED